MFFLFGWGHPKVTNHGAVESRQCPHCHNERRWQLVETSSWFTVFFIPLIRTGHKHELLCPICHFGYELTEGDLERFRPNP